MTHCEKTQHKLYIALKSKTYLESSPGPMPPFDTWSLQEPDTVQNGFCQPQDVITTVVIDEVHNRSAHSDYVLALTLAALQKSTDLRLVLVSATGDQLNSNIYVPQH